MKVFVSSYAAAKPGAPWDREGEAALFEGLAKMGLAGLELPFYGRLHAHDDAWLLEQLRPDWRYVITLLPGTMERLKTDERFGLASTDKDGRQRALDFAEAARRTIAHLRGYLGLKSVAAVCLHSAPRKLASNKNSSPEALTSSLSDLRSRDWSGAELLIEHCDAAVPGHTADKGFLRLSDECGAVKKSKGATPARILINWGRSAVETRTTAGPVAHIGAAKKAGLLGGLFFSGATARDPDYGAWKDAHAPFAASRPASALTVDAAKKALAAGGDVDYLGLKIQPLPASLDVKARLAMIRANLDELKKAGA